MAKLTRFAELSPLAATDSHHWFHVYRLPVHGEIYAIFEPYHFQEVCSYLTVGAERALLFDTGMGIGNIKEVVEQLTSLPLTVVNSHSHFDHTGDDWRFDSVHLLDVPAYVSLLETGYALPADDENLTLDAYHYPGELWFDYTKLEVKPCKVTPVEIGHIFDLGDCRFRVLATPGHSDDGLMLADDENKILFTGDTIYPAPLYAHLSQSNLDTYIETVRHLIREFTSYTLICSHNNPVWEGSALIEIGDAFDTVRENKKLHPEVQQYPFGDFSIIA